MGELKVIIGIENDRIIKVLDKMRDSGKRMLYDGSLDRVMDVLKVRGFSLMAEEPFDKLASPLRTSFYEGFRAEYGDFNERRYFSKDRPVTGTGKYFGPATVIAMGINTGDRHLLMPHLRESIRILKGAMPNLPKEMSYVGLYYYSFDPSVINKDELRLDVESLIREFN